MLTRRSALLGATSTALLSSMGLSRRAWSGPSRGARPPRYWVVILLSGGIDSILTFDPKTRSEVEAGVDLPYAPAEILEKGGARLGPHVHGFAEVLSELTIVNGVRARAANHPTGAQTHLRMMNSAPERMPSILEILGARRDGQPLSSLALGLYYGRQQYSPQYFGVPTVGTGLDGADLLARIDASAPDDLEKLARVLAREARSLRSSGDAVSAESVLQASRLFERLPAARPFRHDPWLTDGGVAKEMSSYLQRTLWALENDLTAGVYVGLGGIGFWDSHTNNDAQQLFVNRYLDVALPRFLKELGERSNRFGRLRDQTAVVISSELGRFPFLNSDRGKDHFPQVSVALSGPWFRGHRGGVGAFGGTGKKMEALAVSPRTGSPDSRGVDLQIDDVGSLMLRLSGLDNELFGYRASNMDFVLA